MLKKIVVYGTQSFRKIIKGAFEILKIQKTVQDEKKITLTISLQWNNKL